MDVVTLGMAKGDARRRYAPRPQTAVVLGDSLTEQGGEIPANPDTRSFSAWPWANVLLGQAFTVLANMGIGGETTTQIRARAKDVVALKPGWVILTAGTNNMGVVDGVATAKTDIAAMLDTFEAAGIRVVLPTLPPRLLANYTGTTKADTFALNEWIRAQGRTRPGLIVPDYFAGLAAGADGNFAASLYGFNPTVDGIHLSATGGYQAGLILANALRPYVTPAVPFSLPNPGANLIANPRPAGNGAVAPTSWSVGTATWSDVPRADGLGSWKQAVLGTGTFNMNTNASVDGTRLAVGDVVNAVIEFDVSGMDQAAANDAQGIAVSLRAWNGTAYTTPYLYAFNYFRGPNVPRSGVIRVPNFTVPAGTTIVSLFVELRGSMTFKFDRAGIYNRKTYAV